MWQPGGMSSRFTPLSLATLVVAALWLPIVLFPYGGALLMNIVFVYGLREYRANRGDDIFKVFTWITGFTCALFLLTAFLVPFEPAYRLLREVALIGWVLREDLPSGQALLVFQVVVVAALLCANPYFSYGFTRSMDTLDAPLPRYMLPRAQYLADKSGILPLACITLIVLQIGYLSGFIDGMGSKRRNIDYWFMQALGREYSVHVPLLVINIVTLCVLTLYALARTHAKALSKKI